MSKTVFVAAALAATTLLAAGLAMFPGSVQEAQADLCSEYTGAATVDLSDIDDLELNCDFEGIGSLIIVEGGRGLTEAPIILPTP